MIPLYRDPYFTFRFADDGRRTSARKRVSENNGDEGAYQFEPKNNTWDLARKFAAESKLPLRILVVVGDKDMNYQANLDWMEHLRSLKIPFEKRIIEGRPAQHGNGLREGRAGDHEVSRRELQEGGEISASTRSASHHDGSSQTLSASGSSCPWKMLTGRICL